MSDASFATMPHMANLTSESLWEAVEAIGSGDGCSARVQPMVIAKLIKFKLEKLAANGLPALTAKGRKAFTVLGSGDGEVPELDEFGSYNQFRRELVVAMPSFSL